MYKEVAPRDGSNRIYGLHGGIVYLVNGGLETLGETPQKQGTRVCLSLFLNLSVSPLKGSSHAEKCQQDKQVASHQNYIILSEQIVSTVYSIFHQCKI